MMMKFELKLPSTKSLKFKFAKMSILLETLNILVANISRFTVTRISSHGKKYSLDFAAQLPSGLASCGIHEQVGGDSLIGHTLAPRQHPDDHIRNTVLGLEDKATGGKKSRCKKTGKTVK